MSDVTIDYAKTDKECLEVHQFLCIVARPHLVVPLDAVDSIKGILDTRNCGAIINARLDGHMVGTLGIIPMTFWYNTKEEFIGNRFFFALPNLKHMAIGAKLLAEAAAIGFKAGQRVMISSHAKRRHHDKPEPFFIREHELAPVDLSREAEGATALN
jgi:hypothetical protein